MKRVKCLWCGRSFDWDDSMYRFCDDCMDRLGVLERMVAERVGKDFDLTALLEEKLHPDTSE